MWGSNLGVAAGSLQPAHGPEWQKLGPNSISRPSSPRPFLQASRRLGTQAPSALGVKRACAHGAGELWVLQAAISPHISVTAKLNKDSGLSVSMRSNLIYGTTWYCKSQGWDAGLHLEKGLSQGNTRTLSQKEITPWDYILADSVRIFLSYLEAGAEKK